MPMDREFMMRWSVQIRLSKTMINGIAIFQSGPDDGVHGIFFR